MLKLLVVDDEPEVLGTIKTMLEQLDARVVALEDARKAARLLNEESFDGMFFDARMPGIDGFELTRIVRRSPHHEKAPIVMLTGLDDADTMRKAFQAGVNFFLGKPVTRERMRRLYSLVSGMASEHLRRGRRLPYRTILRCVAANRSLQCETITISETGMLFQPAAGLAEGEQIQLEFHMPGSKRLLNLPARVLRKEPPNSVAAEFVDLPPGDRVLIRQYLGVEG